ncbi:MAG: hypothetical protein Q7T55_23280 [Solirubrobacteraceae bacterium]|nr:hypothetical protein [Solirubrobacteraceae bacterium]
MGATKKRRQTKHRGNAAGMVETRGRTSSGGASTGSSGARGPRIPQPPSWQKAFTKALIPFVLLLVLMPFLAKDRSFAAIIPLALFAYVFYVPISFYSDKFVYERFVKKSKVAVDKAKGKA